MAGVVYHVPGPFIIADKFDATGNFDTEQHSTPIVVRSQFSSVGVDCQLNGAPLGAQDAFKSFFSFDLTLRKVLLPVRVCSEFGARRSG